ncbi:MAG: Glu-tRNA(Gln) amidotransferase subunit GatE [Candidatus Methanosuratincola petrocarbonis]
MASDREQQMGAPADRDGSAPPGPAAVSSQAGSGGGVRVGIEIHQQLDTRHKLFCGCPTSLSDRDPDYSVVRRLRPTHSEMGQVDRAALFESTRGKRFVYQGHYGSACLVELDEEPPHGLNGEAVSVALTVAAMMNMKPVDEIHVMRKIVIDGSNTTGFQRTAKVALDGWIEVGGRKVTIQSLCLEEDAARKVSESEDAAVYRLDRLGIPLVEVTTGPDMHSGVEAEEAALAIGRILKATGKVKRGLGAIRQDLNVSVEGGTRIEIKGVQELGMISSAVEYEAMRQRRLLEIRAELLRRGAPDPSGSQFSDLTGLLKGTGSKVLRRAIDTGGRVMGVLLRGYGGLLKEEVQPGRRFGTELSDRAKARAGVGGIFHTDELPAYGITPDEVSSVRRALGASESDCAVLVAAPEPACRAALEAVVERASEALRGIPPEVRAANQDGTTRFMRPMPGSARMYPETDVPSIVVSPSRLEEVRRSLPETLESKAERYRKEYGLSRDLALLIVDSPYAAEFESIVRDGGADPSFVAATFEYTFKMLRREGVDVDSFDPGMIKQVLLGASSGKIPKEAVPEIFRWLSANREKGVGEALKALSVGAVSPEEVRSAVAAVVERNLDLVRREGERAKSRLMGDLMKEYRGKVDGKLLFSLLDEEIRKRAK